MNYEIVNLEEKTLVNLRPTRLKNSDPEIGNKIGNIWLDFSKKFDETKKQVIDKPICTYSNYESDEKGEYDCSVGCEIFKDMEIPNGWILKKIPSGKYAKFIISNKTKSIKEFWKNFWNMSLPRKFDCDFEEHQNDDPLNGKVYIFVGLK